MLCYFVSVTHMCISHLSSSPATVHHFNMFVSEKLIDYTLQYTENLWNHQNATDWQGWARDVEAQDRDRDVGLTSRDETEMRRWYVSRQRQWNHNPVNWYTAALPKYLKLDSVTSSWEQINTLAVKTDVVSQQKWRSVPPCGLCGSESISPLTPQTAGVQLNNILEHQKIISLTKC